MIYFMICLRQVFGAVRDYLVFPVPTSWSNKTGRIFWFATPHREFFFLSWMRFAPLFIASGFLFSAPFIFVWPNDDLAHYSGMTGSFLSILWLMRRLGRYEQAYRESITPGEEPGENQGTQH